MGELLVSGRVFSVKYYQASIKEHKKEIEEVIRSDHGSYCNVKVLTLGLQTPSKQ